MKATHYQIVWKCQFLVLFVHTITVSTAGNSNVSMQFFILRRETTNTGVGLRFKFLTAWSAELLMFENCTVIKGRKNLLSKTEINLKIQLRYSTLLTQYKFQIWHLCTFLTASKISSDLIQRNHLRGMWSHYSTPSQEPQFWRSVS